MHAADIMSTPVISVKPEMTVREVAKVFVEQKISGAPVVDAEGHIVGMISEGDLIHRAEVGTEQPRRPRWLDLFSLKRDANEYVKSHGKRVADVMTADVVSVDEATPLSKIADTLERKRIKRVPVTREGKLVGIVTRANLVQALASAPEEELLPIASTDREIRAMLMGELTGRSWAFAGRNIVVTDGIVHVWGMYRSADAVSAVCVAAAGIPGVKSVQDHTQSYEPLAWGL